VNIYLTGASGTGKTTVAKILKDKLNLNHLDSISRSCPYPINTNKAQRYISEKTYEQAMNVKNSVMDRTPFDCAAYCSGFGLAGLEQDNLRAKNFGATKPFVVLFPIFWPAKDDGFRPTSSTLNSVVDSYIVYLLNTNKINYITVKDNEPESRAEYIKSKWEQYNGINQA
jgi:hypothetical protein